MNNQGFANVALLIILAIIVLGGGYLLLRQKPEEKAAEPATLPVKETTEVPSPITEAPAPTCLPNTPPSITITNPIAGASYTVGQNINITWTACNVQNISLGLVSGGKDFGEIAQNIPASLGSYQWQVSNPAQAFTGSNINTYQIVAQSLSPDVTVRSGTFSVQ